MTTTTAKRVRFHELHHSDRMFLIPNPFDAGSAKLLAGLGFPALATTSSGFAWTLGLDDHGTTREQLLDHVAALAATVDVPLSVDSESCYGKDPSGVAETVRLLGEAGASGLSIEDYDPGAGQIVPVELATERVVAAAEAAHRGEEPMVLCARADNYFHGRRDLDDTIARLVAYRDAGADCLYAPGMTDLAEIRRLVDEVAAPVNVLLMANGPSLDELAAAGVRRVSVGGSLARVAYGAVVAAGRAILDGDSVGASAGALSWAELRSLMSAGSAAT